MHSILKAWLSHPPWARRVAAAVLALLVGLGISTLLFPRAAADIGPIGLLVGGVAAGVAFLTGARRLESRERLSWTLVGVGLLLIASGVVAFAIVSSLAELSAFGPPDLLLLAGYASGIIGFGLLPQMATDWSQRLRAVLDALIGAVSISVIAWLLVLGDLLGGLKAYSAWDRWAGSSYPILDVIAMVAIILVFLRRTAYRFDVRLVIVACAFVAQAVADVSYLSSGVGRSFEQARPLFALNIAALILFFLAGLIVTSRPERREYADRSASLAALSAPYSLAVVMGMLLIAKTLRHQVDEHFWALLWGTLIVGGLVVLRQIVAIREYRVMVERQRSALVSSISHELRTPLTAIVGFLDLATDGAALASEEREEMLGVVHQQARYMARIVSDLILLARGNLDSVDLSPSRLPLSDLIHTALAGVDRGVAMISVELEANPLVFVDAERIQQLIINLVSNAIRYGGGRVDVVARTENGDLVIEVHDDGVGVPVKYEYSIWERFERGSHRLDATRPGSGIGLAIVRAVAKAHGGTAEYRRSDRLDGSCFYVRLPRRIVDGAREAALGSRRPA